jgi:hypothetical protein
MSVNVKVPLPFHRRDPRGGVVPVLVQQPGREKESDRGDEAEAHTVSGDAIERSGPVRRRLWCPSTIAPRAGLRGMPAPRGQGLAAG